MSIPAGCCQCGCGNKTRLARQNNPKHGHVKGRPLRYLNGHNPSGRTPRPRLVLAPDATKRCCACGESLPVANFTRNPRAVDGLRGRCNECIVLARRLREQADPEAARATRRRNNFRSRVGLDDETIAWVDILLRDPCSYCGGPATTLDHIVPGGDNDHTNLAPACARCNSSKGKRPLLMALLGFNGYWLEVPPGAQVVARRVAA